MAVFPGGSHRAAPKVDGDVPRRPEQDPRQNLPPTMRGWLHAGWTPMTIVAGSLLTVLAPPGTARITVSIFAVTSVVLFGTSALYHRGRWGARARTALRRLDHANIFLVIAGSYTPLSALLLPRREAVVLLSAVWSAAVAGAVFKLALPGAPRWVGVPLYLLLGWAAVAYLPLFLRHGGATVLTLLVVGGVLYSVGGIVYAVRRPDPNPRRFGYHEVFHALTLGAFSCHFAAVSMVALRG